MNDVDLHIAFALRSDDVEKWMNILLVVVLAAFWAIATLIKAKVKQNQDREEDDRGRQRPAKRSPLGTRWAQRPTPQMGRSYPARRPTRVPAGAQRRDVPERKVIPTEQPPAPKRPAQSPELAPPAESTLLSLTMQPEPTLEDELPSLTTTPLGVPAEIYEGSAQQAFEEQPLLESLLDYDDPAELRRAILHYEILGKPLSLRDPGEQTVGF